MDIDSRIRPNIRALKPYHCARQDFLSGVLLDANENAFGSVLEEDGISLNRYPDPFQREIRNVLAGMNGVGSDNVFVGVGSDEVIDLLVRIFCEPRADSIVLLEPTYGMYRVAASIQDIEVRSCLLTKEFQIDVDAAAKCIDASTKLLFCCSPNNPTANLLRSEDILALCRLGVVVVVDEAYGDFSGGESLAQKVSVFPNLVVMRTLSKAWGLAGIRLGYCVADPRIIAYLMKVKAPYNVNALTSRAALEALRKIAAVRNTVEAILRERKRLSRALEQQTCIRRVYPSETNFILVRCTDANTLYGFLAKKNIIVRNRSTEPLLENCLRITVGTPEENELLINAVKEFCP